MRARTVAAIAAPLLVLATAAAGWVLAAQPAPGLRARVFRSHNFDGLPIVELDDRELSIDRLASAAGVPGGEAFGVQWTGWLFVPVTGRYVFDLAVDDGAEVWLGDRLIVEVKGPPGIYRRGGPADLTAGVYPVEIRYRQFLGERRFSFRWSPPRDRDALAMPAFLLPSTTPPSRLMLVAARRLPLAAALAWSIAIVAALAAAFIHAARLSAPAAELLVLSRMPAILVPMLLTAAGIAWGAYPWRAWHPDEVVPADIIYAVQQRFSGGWHTLYPPLQFVLTAVVLSPIFAAERAGVLSFGSADVLTAFHVSMRGISLVMAMLTLATGYAIGREAVGRRRAAVAVYFAGTAQVMAYYGKTANVDMPYVFWVTAAMLFFVRAAKHRRTSDHVALGIAAGLAMATKDQAYGFFAGPALALLWRSWRDHRAHAIPARLRRTLFDRRLWAGAAAAVVVGVLGFGLPWNYQGFQAHVNNATGFRMEGFRMFDSGVIGQIRLLGYSLQLAPWSFGMITVLLAVAGIVVAAVRRRRFGGAWLLAAPVASYYVSVIMVIGYNYDRFMLGFAVPAGVFAALGFEWLRRRAPVPAARHVLAAACAVGAVVPALLMNADMRFGSRHRIERWLESQAADSDPFVVAVANPLYLPRLSPFRRQILNQVEDNIAEWRADLIVLNEDWVARVPRPRREVEALLRRGAYEEIYRDVAAPRPWWSVVFTGVPPADSTNLLKVSPSYTVWRRQP